MGCKSTVSVITITQFKRFECLKILYELIKLQTYKNIIEWVIVEGSANEIDADINKKLIDELIEKSKSELIYPIIYIARTENNKLGELRNIGNNSCCGDITVCMDDDDYYFPDRVQHAVNKLDNSKYLIAGCSNHLMYDYDLNMLVKMKSFGSTHSINSCMAWKKEYLLSHSHDSNAELAEETSFTNNFTVSMIGLNPFSTVIISSHSSNTFNKKPFFYNILNQISSPIDRIIYKRINKFIPDKILQEYKNIFIKSP